MLKSDPCNTYCRTSKKDCNFFKTIRMAEKVYQVGSNSSLYSDTKRAHAFKGFASSYNVEILNSFYPSTTT